MNDHNILAKICADKRAHIENQKQRFPLAEIKKNIVNVAPPRGFLKALQKKVDLNRPALIAEIKKASPSKGLIREDFDPVSIAQAYERAGATALSILTDVPYFQGHDDYLNLVKNHVRLPVLRKDFMIDAYQIYESRLLGADCILLIMAAVDDDLAYELFKTAKSLRMDVLVEVHNHKELERGLLLSPDLVGVNNRNLKTLEIDLDTSYELLKHMPLTATKVAESGIYSHKDLAGFHEAGFNAFLVGESLMRQDDIEAATKNLLGMN